MSASIAGAFVASSTFTNRAQAFHAQDILYRFRSLSRKQDTAAPLSSAQAQTAINSVSPSTVFIYGYSEAAPIPAPAAQPDQQFLPPFFSWPFSISLRSAKRETAALKTVAGTGFFVTPDGYIVTNKHVVSDTSAVYQIDLPDGTEKIGQVVFRDPSLDLALIKIPGQGYPVLPLGDSSAVAVGETVFSMGNAFGNGQAQVSAGKVLAIHQDILAGDGGPDAGVISDTFEISTQLYPGDSGGPTFDLSGNVVAINVAMSTDVPNDSYAIPINYVKDMVAMATGNK